MSEAHDHHEAPSIPFEDLPERMKRARHRMGWDQADIANYLGIHQRTVANYETGKTEPKLALLMAWANLTNVPLDWLTFGVEPCACGGTTEPTTRSRCFPENTQVSVPKLTKLEGNVFYPSFDAPRNRPAPELDGNADVVDLVPAN